MALSRLRTKRDLALSSPLRRSQVRAAPAVADFHRRRSALADALVALAAAWGVPASDLQAVGTRTLREQLSGEEGRRGGAEGRADGEDVAKAAVLRAIEALEVGGAELGGGAGGRIAHWRTIPLSTTR